MKDDTQGTVNFDPEDPDSPEQREERLRDIRRNCPVAHSDAHGGFWLISRYDDVATVLSDADTFSSAKVLDETTGEYVGGTILPAISIPRMIPPETDSPEWDRYRGVLNPHFGPRSVEARRERAKALTHAFIDKKIESGRMDFVLDLGNPLSAIITMSALGLPLDDWQRWALPFHEQVYLPSGSPELAHVIKELNWINEQLALEIQERRRAPADDLISALIAEKLADGPLSDEEILELSLQVMGGAIETTTALTANAWFHLHRNHPLRDRLTADRSLLRPAFDEYLRFFSPVTNLARTVKNQTEIRGQKLCPGDRVLVSFSSANRDETVFDKGDEIIVDRSPNRHLAMGRGKHFCLGAFQARMMFEVMMNAVLDRLPDYRVLEEEATRYPSIGNVNGWVNMPAIFTPGVAREPFIA